MKRLLESARYLTVIAVLAALVGSVVVFGWGVYKTGEAIQKTLAEPDKSAPVIAAFIKAMDVFLVAIALLIFAVAVYELFIGELDMPEWLAIHNFHGLKAKLSSVIILVMAVTYLEHFLEWTNAQDTLYFGVALAVVALALVAYSQLGGAD